MCTSLLRAQRGPLVVLTKAYRSISTPALSVLAGLLLAYLVVILAGKVECECRGLPKPESSRRKKAIMSKGMGREIAGGNERDGTPSAFPGDVGASGWFPVMKRHKFFPAVNVSENACTGCIWVIQAFVNVD